MRTRRPHLLAGAAVGAVVVAVLAVLLGGPYGLGGSSASPAAPERPAGFVSPTGLFVDPQAEAAVQAEQWRTTGRTADAERLGELAAQPIPQWATAPTTEIAATAGSYVRRARAVGQRPFLVAYHIPHRDCAGFSAGGADDAADYKDWVRAFAGALGGQAATVVLEPDAVPHAVSGCAGRAAERYALLTDAVDVLKGAGATVYVDAGNPGFITDVRGLADALERSGVAKADGFSLNVANFYPTADTVAYGKKISDALGGAHFVIDTSRNGNGRAPGETVDGGPVWCNPPGRAVGQIPTLNTGVDRVDAFLWIKRPGESDGACRPGEPAAGQFMPDYALNLVPKV